MVHRVSGEVMVVKQLLAFDRDAQESFLKEVHIVTVDSVSVGCLCVVPCVGS